MGMQEAMRSGRYNVGVGLVAMAVFMAYGFLLIYLRDFHPEREAWIASYGAGKHFEARLAHVHGNLFGLLNIAIGFILVRLQTPGRLGEVTAWLALGGLVMPLGILAEVYLGAPPVFVLLGAVSMVAAVALSGWLALRYWGATGTVRHG